jgi:hypothetical protein
MDCREIDPDDSNMLVRICNCDAELKDKQFAEKDNQDLVRARDFGDDCLKYTTYEIS